MSQCKILLRAVRREFYNVSSACCPQYNAVLRSTAQLAAAQYWAVLRAVWMPLNSEIFVRRQQRQWTTAYTI